MSYKFAEIRALRRVAEWTDLEHHWGLRYRPDMDDGTDECLAVTLQLRVELVADGPVWERGHEYGGPIPQEGWHTVPQCECRESLAERSRACQVFCCPRCAEGQGVA